MTIAMSPPPAAAHGPRESGAANARPRTGAKDDANSPASFVQALSAADEAPADNGAAAGAPAGATDAGSQAKAASSRDSDARACADRDADPDAAADAVPASSSSGTAASDTSGHRPASDEPPPSATAADNALLLAQSALCSAVPPAAPSNPASANADAATSGTAAVGSALMPTGRAVPRGPVSVQAPGTVPDRADTTASTPDTRTGAANPAFPAGAAASKAIDAANAFVASDAAPHAADSQPAAWVSTSASQQPTTPQLASQDAAQKAIAVPMSAEASLQQAAAMPEALIRRADRADERKSASDALPGIPSGSAITAGSSALMAPVDPGSASASTGQSLLTDRMLEQVSWWLSQKTQGAELTLDVARGHSVSVSVQVQGNEAHVAFRSDQPEVRQMLGQAMPQLKELLGSEGLMLSGSSVGSHADTSGQSAAQEGARPWRAGGDAASASAAPAAPVIAPVARPRAPSGRSLDLYV